MFVSQDFTVLTLPNHNDPKSPHPPIMMLQQRLLRENILLQIPKCKLKKNILQEHIFVSTYQIYLTMVVTFPEHKTLK